MIKQILTMMLAGLLGVLPALCAEEGPVVGIVEWTPGLEREANAVDKTDYWAAIAFSPSTGKFRSSGAWTSRDNAERAARENCHAPDARSVVLCCNGWCALALGPPSNSEEQAWGVGWGPRQEVAETFALENARERAIGAKVVFSINARTMLVPGVIAYSTETGKWGYSFGHGRNDIPRAVQACDDPDAKIMVSPQPGAWMALALGDDQRVYDWGYAGNRVDAEQNALRECSQRTSHVKVAISFCTSGVTH